MSLGDLTMLAFFLVSVAIFVACVVFIWSMIRNPYHPEEGPPRKCIHDWDMKFVGEESGKVTLDAYYQCSKCGQKRTLMPEPWEMIE